MLVDAVYPEGSYDTIESRLSTERPPGHEALQGDLVDGTSTQGHV